MKKIPVIALLILSAAFAQAQSPKYMDAMKKALAEMDTAKTSTDFVNVSNKFERIALAEKNQWLPDHYDALARATSIFLPDNKGKIDDVLDVAQKWAAIADSLEPNNSEITVLQSMILGGRIMVDPASRGQQYGMQSFMTMNKAMQEDPNNPRAYLLMGQSLFYTPEQFGGGKEKGCAMFQVAQQKYATFKPASEIAPNWGKDQLDQLMQDCGSASPKTDSTGVHK